MPWSPTAPPAQRIAPHATRRPSSTSASEATGGVSAFVAELIEFHLQNEVVAPYFEGVDQDELAGHLVDFIGAGTGGPESYGGRSILESHAGMGVTPEAFLAAGGDIGAAMQAVGWGPDEQEEFLCILLSRKDDVLVQPGSEE